MRLNICLPVLNTSRASAQLIDGRNALISKLLLHQALCATALQTCTGSPNAHKALDHCKQSNAIERQGSLQLPSALAGPQRSA